jgi:ATP-dependent helicase/nuclease subunit A
MDVIAAAGLAQARAAWPGQSAWVSANAGSGKTRVLTSRVARLLLAGSRPERILCLTYTKAAAAEMTNRLTALLGRWALMDDAPLAEELAALEADSEGATPPRDAEALAAARRLFAQALETPGGLKIQTIHAFCDSVLRRFPLEAGVSPDFQVLDDAARRELAMRARDRLAEDAAAGRDAAFDAMAAHLTDEGLDGLARSVLARRALFDAPPGAPALAAAFGLTEAALDEAPIAALRAALDPATLARAGAILAAGGPKERPVGEALREAARAPSAPAFRDALAAAILTSKGEPRKALANKGTLGAHDWLASFLETTAAGFLAALERDRAIEACRRALALNRFGARLLEAYDTEKRALGALDYDDLIAGAARLFERSEMAAWALYKLDGGVDHVLVDEAQDTAPAQWAVIEALTAEFFAGAGVERPERTLFVVGDEKQSIYSFQGAEPGIFGAKREGFRTRALGAGQRFDSGVTLATSFRSAPAILRVVDRTFDAAPEGLGAPGERPDHAAAFPDRPGRVDVWPLLEKSPAAEDPPWTAPIDAPPPGDPKLALARLIAEEIAGWLARGERLPGGGEPVRPGDVMVLVRRRDRLAAELVRRLKQLGVPVAGADRLKLAEDLAVKDLLALARFALTPGDDLTLAAVLRSPLCGLSEAQLFAAAHYRDGSLWGALRDGRARWPEAVAFLEAAQAKADFLRPYEFLDHALTALDGRRRLLARLGIEAEDPIDELLAQALAYEQAGPPTLEGFLAWVGRGDLEIKREMDKGAGEVRVMTVHGAKGLEAPVVILPDTVGRLGGRKADLLPLPVGNGLGAAWNLAKADAPEALRAAQREADQRALEESRRLLYVAMTRAERWLIVCGAGETAGETWHGLVSAGARAATGRAVRGPEALGAPIFRVSDAPETAAEPMPLAPEQEGSTPPAWTRAPAPPPASRPKTRAASDLGGEPAAGGGGPRDAENARRRGEMVHALLEVLPDAPPSERAARAAALFAAHMPEADAAARAEMRAEAERAMALPEASAVFAPDALAEAAVSIEIPGLGRISGRIDRLAIGARAILAVDFKTDAQPPARPGDASEPYLRQMAAYREALRALYPDQEIIVALLWTATPALHPLPDPALDAALARAAAER